LQDPTGLSSPWRDRWQAAPRLSLADSFAQADGDRLLSDILNLDDYIAGRNFYAAVEAERPAAELKPYLGTASETIRGRCQQLETWFSRADPMFQLRAYKALAEASGQPHWEDRAFATLAGMIETAVLKQAPPISQNLSVEPEKRVRVKAAARIDFGGGWTDTPPYSLECGGVVLNAAITLNDAHPIIAEAAYLPEPKLVLESRDIETTLEPTHVGEVLAYANPADPFALHKAAIVMRGLISAADPAGMTIADCWQRRGWGLRLSTATHIPRGSGLGTSSIMAGAVLSALARLLNLTVTQAQLFDEVLYLEQMLTTGGGWQDQVGGLTGGIKLATTRPGLPQKIQLELVSLSPQVQNELARRLLLIYTGQQRLAKNLLRAVMGRWLARDPEMVWILKEIARLARAMQSALQAGDLDHFGRLLGEHWLLNKRMDPGCTNPFIDRLFAALAPYIYGGKLAGAGGGGFAFVITKDQQAAAELKAMLNQVYRNTGVELWGCQVPESALVAEGLRQTIDWHNRSARSNLLS
jgi:fucokinase